MSTDTKLDKRLKEKLDRCAARAKTRAATTADPADPTVELSTTQQPSAKRGRATLRTVEQHQLNLLRGEREGRFDLTTLNPGGEYPTLLTRLPIFPPAKREHQRGMVDNDNAYVFETSWGIGRRHGPPLTVYDEDTLIALSKLRRNRVIGQPHRFPIPIAATPTNPSDTQVHTAMGTILDIEAICMGSRNKRGGDNYSRRLDSVKRLAASTIEFDGYRKGARSTLVTSGTTVKLIDVAWQRFYEDAVIIAQFTPIMANWLDQEYTYINWEIRQQLTPTGKAVHRFLSGQPKKYRIGVEKLMLTIGYRHDLKEFMRALRKTMKTLTETGWISTWEITGTGRSQPKIMALTRP